MDFASAISGVGSMLQIATTAIQARDDSKAKQAIADVQMKLFELLTAALSMTEKNISLLNEVMDLQEKLQAIESKNNERSGYVLVQVTPGSWAYESRSSSEGEGSQAHHLCQPCYDKGTKSILRRMEEAFGIKFMQCPENKDHRIELA